MRGFSPTYRQIKGRFYPAIVTDDGDLRVDIDSECASISEATIEATAKIADIEKDVQDMIKKAFSGVVKAKGS